MRLSKKELRLISDIEKSRKYRKLGAWVFLLFIPIFYRWYPQVSALLAGFGIASLIHVYVGTRPDDELIDLLQRYINSDPEALVQVSKTSNAGA